MSSIEPQEQNNDPSKSSQKLTRKYIICNACRLAIDMHNSITQYRASTRMWLREAKFKQIKGRGQVRQWQR